MDLHQAERVLRPDPDVGLEHPGRFLHWQPSQPVLSGGTSIDVSLAPGTWREYPIPAWAHVLLWVERGLCLSNPDGEEPDVPAGHACVYRVRNRPSGVFLVAGPEGCQGKLILLPREE
ncbi:MAG TPA: hypothetical protein PKO15_01105 [Fibrobacteria bacterium]|nr:hypothetical protein [Fibrobacteria bacterium]HOX50692.1 hypothetical protein [Fibrobacteria bacterium]